MPPFMLLGLILSNLVWSSSPAMTKIVLQDFPPFQVAWFRYTSAFVAFLAWQRVAPKDKEEKRPFSRRDYLLCAVGGFATFCFSPLLQASGLTLTQALDGALIIAMEPLITVILAWIFLRERMSLAQVLSFAIAILGFAMLSGLAERSSFMQWDGKILGNLAVLAALFGEAMYSIIGRPLMQRHSAARVFVWVLGFGVLFLTLSLLMGPGFPDFSRFHASSLLAVLWLGPVGTFLTYLFWMRALKMGVPIATLALTLLVQPISGSLLGYFWLDERLGWIQLLGGILILLALAWEAGILKKSPSPL